MWRNSKREHKLEWEAYLELISQIMILRNHKDLVNNWITLLTILNNNNNIIIMVRKIFWEKRAKSWASGACGAVKRRTSRLFSQKIFLTASPIGLAKNNNNYIIITSTTHTPTLTKGQIYLLFNGIFHLLKMNNSR